MFGPEKPAFASLACRISEISCNCRWTDISCNRRWLGKRQIYRAIADVFERLNISCNRRCGVKRARGATATPLTINKLSHDRHERYRVIADADADWRGYLPSGSAPPPGRGSSLGGKIYRASADGGKPALQQRMNQWRAGLSLATYRVIADGSGCALLVLRPVENEHTEGCEK